VRGVLATANVRATVALARQPAAHEEMLDFQVFAAIDEAGPSILGSDIAVDIDTHWLGLRTSAVPSNTPAPRSVYNGWGGKAVLYHLRRAFPDKGTFRRRGLYMFACVAAGRACCTRKRGDDPSITLPRASTSQKRGSPWF
jgi:hypothetical protein